MITAKMTQCFLYQNENANKPASIRTWNTPWIHALMINKNSWLSEYFRLWRKVPSVCVKLLETCNKIMIIIIKKIAMWCPWAFTPCCLSLTPLHIIYLSVDWAVRLYVCVSFQCDLQPPYRRDRTARIWCLGSGARAWSAHRLSEERHTLTVRYKSHFEHEPATDAKGTVSFTPIWKLSTGTTTCYLKALYTLWENCEFKKAGSDNAIFGGVGFRFIRPLPPATFLFYHVIIIWAIICHLSET